MEKFNVHILGCGSALPTSKHLPSAQVVNIREKLFLVDCGEGTQLQFRKARLKFGRLNHIFISHLHGDHCFGLIGLLSTLGLLGRTAPLHIYAHAQGERLLQPWIDYFCNGMKYEVVFHAIDPKQATIIYEDRSLTVETIPLQHRVPTCGFLFREKPTSRHIIREMIDFYQVPTSQILRIKNGEDFITEEGKVVSHTLLTTPSAPPRAYAYCSDTAYLPSIVPQIQGIDLLYHEATFCAEDTARAKETMHTTAVQAGQIAAAAQVKKLLIGHFSARYENEDLLLKEAQAHFPETSLAHEQMTLSL